MWDQRQRATSFGSDAARYDRARPSYPGALIDDLMADRPRRVLDIGCGTGKAGRLLAARGCEVLGVEADERMAAVARAHGLAVETATLEQWDSRGRAFDLVVCGQAWHWIEPVAGLARVAAVLPPGRRLAVFWNSASYDDDTAAALHAIYRRLAPAVIDDSTIVGHVPDARLGHDLQVMAASAAFLPPEEATYHWRQDYDATAFADLLGTHSEHRRLPRATFAAVTAEVGRLVASLGGDITVRYRTRMLTAVRRDV